MIPKFLAQNELRTYYDVHDAHDLSAIHNLACAYTVEQFKRYGEIPPTWIIKSPLFIGGIETPWEDTGEKIHAINVMRAMFKEFKVNCYSSITEAWSAASNLIPEDERDHWIKVAQEEGLSNFPEKYRD